MLINMVKTTTQVQHGGGIEGFNAFISRIIEDQLLVIILTTLAVHQ